ncbi:MAG: hypothetical protein WB778_02865 [Thermoplasmata archaeon]
MRNARVSSPAVHFLGVRLTEEEVGLLDQYRTAQQKATRSDAIRSLVRSGAQPPAAPLELPAAVRAALEDLVEDGWASDVRGAIELTVTLGLGELARLHAEKIPGLRAAARASEDRRKGRRRADREGRGLLGR